MSEPNPNPPDEDDDDDEEDEEEGPSDIEQLKEEIKGIQLRVDTATDTSADGAWAAIRQEIIPFLAALTKEVADIDTVIQEVVEEMPDSLQPETAAVFAGIIASGKVIAAELGKRIGNTEPRISQLLREFRGNLDKGAKILEEITVEVATEDPAPNAGAST